jgi:putative ABC transport system permease protein
LITSDQVLGLFDRLTGVFFLVMIVLSSVALMVGGIGVMAIMLVSVTERTREIGIRMALGATRREILWQFLVEAATLTMIGGVIGVIGSPTRPGRQAVLQPQAARAECWQRRCRWGSAQFGCCRESGGGVGSVGAAL